MEKIQLSAFLKILGVGAASGIVNTNNSLYIISDSAGFLYQYDLDSNKLQKHKLIENATENILKKVKPDFESITLKNNELYIFGSGSTQNRNQNIVFNLDDNQVHENDLTELYSKIKTVANISNDDLNIEGALFLDEYLFLFQRGNGASSENGIVKINCKDNDNFNGNDKIQYHKIQLPKIKHVETSFTDAILVDDKIYFLAAAEDTTSTYDDGEVLGSIIGCMDATTFKIDFTHQISSSHKFEGLTLFKQTDDSISFLLCEDNDTEELKTIIYELVLKS